MKSKTTIRYYVMCRGHYGGIFADTFTSRKKAEKRLKEVRGKLFYHYPKSELIKETTTVEKLQPKTKGE